MTAALYLFLYAMILVFAAGCAVRIYRYATAPMHLRWELYPVPHEEPHRVQHGGSYFEAPDWWTRPVHFNLAGELKFMIPEMLFLKGLWEFNRPMWRRSFPFHFGLYLLIATAALAAVAAALDLIAAGTSSTSLGWAIARLYTVTGLAGAILCVVGALGLLHRRLTDPKLRLYTTPGDIFNLVFFVVAVALLFAGFASGGPGTPGPAAIVRGLIRFDTGLEIPATLAVGLALAGLLIAYIPMTHMSHFIAKWFTYHEVRWDDQPIAHSRRLARKLAEQLAYRPTWAAAHVGADGSKTWADIATTNPAQGAKR